MRIYLLGYMGCGKSTFGPKLSMALQIPFHDLDDVFEERYKISINNFFIKYGEEYFRKIESALLRELSIQDDYILATGGGTPCFNENMEFMRSHGITVYMQLSPDELSQRLKASPKKRPVLRNFKQDNFMNHLNEHLKERGKFYRQSQLIVDGKNPDPEEIAETIRRSTLFSSGE
jgi:shikimate kinase